MHSQSGVQLWGMLGLGAVFTLFFVILGPTASNLGSS
jgi:hypothetical protein